MRVLLWTSWVLITVSALLIAGHLVAFYLGMSASYNFGDPGKYEFFLVSFWKLALGALLPGLGVRYMVKKTLIYNNPDHLHSRHL